MPIIDSYYEIKKRKINKNNRRKGVEKRRGMKGMRGRRREEVEGREI